MRKLKGNWTDIFQGFSVAFDFKKLFAAYIGLFLSLIVIVGTAYLSLFRTGFISLKSINGELVADIPTWKMALLAGAVYLVLLLIWSYFGGLISRIAAVNLTKDEGLELNKSIAFTHKKFVSFFTPYIFAIFGVIFFFLLTAAFGLLGRIPFAGEIIVPLLLPLMFLFGFIIVFIVVGFFFGGSLFFPTIAVESSDAFDAVSRSFQYVYAEPWRYIWYCLVSLVYGALTSAFVWLFGGIMILTSLVSLKWGMGDKIATILPPFGDLSQLPISYTIGGFLFLLWMLIVVGLIFSYIISYCFSSHTIIYLLLRKKVDDIEMDEIYEDETPLEELVGTPATPAETPKTETPAEPPK